MYNYEKALPKGYEIEKKIVMGSSAEVFILINSKGNRIVRKISDVEGINRNGKDKLRNEINFLEYFHRTRTIDIYPKIYNYEANNLYVYYTSFMSLLFLYCVFNIMLLVLLYQSFYHLLNDKLRLLCCFLN